MNTDGRELVGRVSRRGGRLILPPLAAPREDTTAYNLGVNAWAKKGEP